MRITWVTRSFLDYRIPLYKALSSIEGVDFILISSLENHVNPERCILKAKNALGDKFIGLKGEVCIGKPYLFDQISNSAKRIFWQPNLISEIKKTKPDIVITDAFNHWTLPVFFLKFLKYDFKHIVCYERTKHTERNASRLKLKFISHIQRYINAVHCNGILCKEFLMSLKYPEEKLFTGNMIADKHTFIASNLTQTQEISERIRTKHNLNQIIYIYVGRLVKMKGLTELIEGWGDASIHDASLLIIGDGPQKEDLEQLILRKQIKNVVMLGLINYDNLPDYYNSANCFVIPTLEDNWSLVVSEAMACKLPIICSIYNGCFKELVKKSNGWLFDPLDHNSVKNTLLESYKSRSDFQKMGEKSSELILEYTPEKIAKKIFETAKKFN
jgi:glycosyltransferase involved in cell wall biosynthesis